MTNFGARARDPEAQLCSKLGADKCKERFVRLFLTGNEFPILPLEPNALERKAFYLVVCS